MKFPHSQIDPERTVEGDNWNKAITAHIHQAEVEERKDSVVMLDGVYTASAEQHTAEEADEFFRACRQNASLRKTKGSYPLGSGVA